VERSARIPALPVPKTARGGALVKKTYNALFPVAVPVFECRVIQDARRYSSVVISVPRYVAKSALQTAVDSAPKLKSKN